MKTSNRWVKCTSAKSRFYTVDGIYEVFTDGKDSFVLGSDGFYDNLGKMCSKFVPYDKPNGEG